jgi:hypothetical protein
MKKFIATLTAMSFLLGLTAAAQAQIAKTPEKPVVESTQTAPSPAAAKAAAQPSAKEIAQPGDKSTEAVKPGEKSAVKKEVKKASQKANKKAAAKKKAGAQTVLPQEGTK